MVALGHEKRDTLYQSKSPLRLLESSQAGQERMWRTVGLVLRCSAIGESYPTAIPLCPRIGQYDIGKAKFRSCNSFAPSPHFPSLSITHFSCLANGDTNTFSKYFLENAK